ncbi:MAG TPA: cytochrome c [Croceibacterium sp.]
MSRLPLAIAVTALASFAATAVAQQPADLVVSLPVPPAEVRTWMQKLINLPMLAIWDVSNSAVDDAGAFDPAQLDDAEWTRLERQAVQLAAAGKGLAEATGFVAAFPENAEVGEGEVTMAAVQAHIDRDSEGFRAAANALAEHAGKIAAAAKARDAATTGTLIGEMDAVCESCHARYWYPE